MRAIRWMATAAAVLAVGACGGNPDPIAGGTPADPCAGAWVQLYEDANFSGRRLTIAYPTSPASLAEAGLDTGAGNLNDRVSSVIWSIPVGCQAVLYEHEEFEGARHLLVGSGRTEQDANLVAFADRASSVRWSRN